MGLFTRFESGGRTDAILRDNQNEAVAMLEWEWTAIHREDGNLNEFDKLRKNCESKNGNRVDFAAFLGYSRSESCNGKDYTALSASKLDAYTKCWVKDLPPLLLFLVHFKWRGAKKGGREFTTLTIDKIESGRKTPLREQPAYPWKVPKSKWELEAKAAT